MMLAQSVPSFFLSHTPQLLQLLEAGSAEYTVRVSFLELYNEELFDLLDNASAPTVCRLHDEL